MSGFSFGTTSKASTSSGQDGDEEPEDDPGPEILADDAEVDVEAERKAANSDEILDRLDRELVGLTPVKTRIREIADLLVVDRLRVQPRNGLADRPPHPLPRLHGRRAHRHRLPDPSTSRSTTSLEAVLVRHLTGDSPDPAHGSFTHRCRY